MIGKLQSNVIQPIVELLYYSDRVCLNTKKCESLTLAQCTVKNGDMSMTSRNERNYIFLLQLLRWATKRLSRSTWHADI